MELMVQFYYSGGLMTFSLEYLKAEEPARGILGLKTACEHVSVARLEETQSKIFSQKLNPGKLCSRNTKQ